MKALLPATRATILEAKSRATISESTFPFHAVMMNDRSNDDQAQDKSIKRQACNRERP